MSKILVGTTSWTEKTLIDSGLFYPPSVKTPEDRLKYYPSQFPITEVDSTYYGLPAERNAIVWAERTPPDFNFHVKAFRLFTNHHTSPSTLPKDIREALGSIDKKNVYYKDLRPELTDELWERFRRRLSRCKSQASSVRLCSSFRSGLSQVAMATPTSSPAWRSSRAFPLRLNSETDSG